MFYINVIINGLQICFSHIPYILQQSFAFGRVPGFLEQQFPVLLDEILNLAAAYTLVIGLPPGSKHFPSATEEPVPAVLFQVPPELGLSV